MVAVMSQLWKGYTCAGKFTVRRENVACFYDSVCFSLYIDPVIRSPSDIFKTGGS